MAIDIDKVNNVSHTYIEDEMKYSYIDYSMSVIIGRALPDARDGLKPVHRRILYAMDNMSLYYNRPYRKSARIVGEVLGKYHPHGDTAVYDSLVRMAQDFSLRYNFVDGQGNFGSIDGDNPAAMRYTEARLSRISQEMLKDINKDTVDLVPNFDESLNEPTVLPSILPNLLLNGSSGIAVGMATNIPPHNLVELVDAIIAQIDDPEITIKGLMKYISGPDLPTGGIIYGRQGIKDMYETGRGRIIVRGKASVEVSKNRERIIITEIPYQVNKNRLITKIADLVQQDKISGISDLRDESDRDGIRIVVELKKNAIPQVILNQLYKHTPLQETLGAIVLAIHNNQPVILTLKEAIDCYIQHRVEVITRRTKFDLKKAEERAHILEGYKKALSNIDEVVETIKKSKTPDIAKNQLIKKFELSEIQAVEVLKLQLQRLTGLEMDKIDDEYRGLIEQISYLNSILENKNLIFELIKDDLEEIKENYGDKRRTEILDDIGEIQIEDMIADDDMVITISHRGYIKRTSTDTYTAQKRGGKGLYGMETNEDDFVEYMFIASNHNYILFFTDKGKCYWLKVYDVPEGSRRNKGKYIVNLLPVETNEKIKSFICVKEFKEGLYLCMLTNNGMLKKTDLTAYSRPKKKGIIAINIREDDELKDVALTDGEYEIVIGTRNGQAIRFKENTIRTVGRNSIGVKGIKIDKKNNDEVIGLITVTNPDDTILTVTENGYGKRSYIKDYRLINRGGKGVINIKTSERNGKVVKILKVEDTDEIMIITMKGIVIRQKVSQIKVIGRATQGVRLIKLNEGDEVVDVAKIAETDDDSVESDDTNKEPEENSNGEIVENNGDENENRPDKE